MDQLFKAVAPNCTQVFLSSLKIYLIHKASFLSKIFLSGIADVFGQSLFLLAKKTCFQLFAIPMKIRLQNWICSSESNISIVIIFIHKYRYPSFRLLSDWFFGPPNHYHNYQQYMETNSTYENFSHLYVC